MTRDGQLGQKGDWRVAAFSTVQSEKLIIEGDIFTFISGKDELYK